MITLDELQAQKKARFTPSGTPIRPEKPQHIPQERATRLFSMVTDPELKKAISKLNMKTAYVEITCGLLSRIVDHIEPKVGGAAPVPVPQPVPDDPAAPVPVPQPVPDDPADDNS